MTAFRSHILVSFMILVSISLQSCAFTKSLRTREISSLKENVSYTVVLYGGRYRADIENLAILQPEGGKYIFQIYSPDFDYNVQKGLSAREALAVTHEFLSRQPDYHRSTISGILDNEGNIIGYEVRPLYYPFTLGTMDYLDVGYFIKEDKVLVKIHLKPDIERRFFDDGGMIINLR